MKARDFEATLKHSPFRRFTIHMDGRAVDVDHPEQVLLTPDKATVVVALPDAGIQILDMDLISSLSNKGRTPNSTKAAH
ncbi:MAG: hypothetical protein EXS31_17090 [Pedosphaera sp.]|nr:hypothetical protein [Pedosphaera sp.]